MPLATASASYSKESRKRGRVQLTQLSSLGGYASRLVITLSPSRLRLTCEATPAPPSSPTLQVRAINSADMAIYHLCVRKKLSEAEMARKAARQLGRSPNAISGWLFQSYSFALRIWLIMHLDLIAAGLLDFFDFMWHAIQVFILSEQDPLKLRILPCGQ